MMKYILVCLSFVIVSCNFSHKQEARNVNMQSDFSEVERDTLIKYDIERISTEGAGAKVNYLDGKIIKAVIEIYADTWQASITYIFGTDKVEVLETKYFYVTEIENIKSDEDMQLDYKISYFIDFKGSVIGKEIPERIDVFKDFQEVVPFELN